MRIMYFFLLINVFMSPFAQALEISAIEDNVYLYGSVNLGDDIKFKNFLASRPTKSVKTIWLNSRGGLIYPARELGRIIRSNGMTTIVDAANSRCESVCTVIFVSGVRRIYLNADGIAEREGGNFGLGFYDTGFYTMNGYPISYGVAYDDLIFGYYEFGVNGAVPLVKKSGSGGTYHTSLRTALEAGVATGSALR